MKEFNIEKLNYAFRPKKMNAIEFLAMRSQVSFDTFEDSVKWYELILSKLEVEFNGKWLPVREEINGQVNYYPAGIEEDVEAITQLANYFMEEVLRPVFTKSNASKV